MGGQLVVPCLEANNEQDHDQKARAAQEEAKETQRPAMDEKEIEESLKLTQLGEFKVNSNDGGVVVIGDSIWTCIGEGIVAFDLKTNAKQAVIPYPDDVKYELGSRVIVGYKTKIYIFQSERHEITEFDTETQEFTVTCEFNKDVSTADQFASACLVPGSKCIHILGGTYNRKHNVYSIEKNTVSVIDSKLTFQINKIALLHYKGTLLRFGGGDAGKLDHYKQDFYQSANVEALQLSGGGLFGGLFGSTAGWKLRPNWELPKEMGKFGYVLVDDFIFIFGGECGIMNSFDSVYSLNLKEPDQGWKLHKLKLPMMMKGPCCAVVVGDTVHILTLFGRNKSVPVAALIASV